MKFRRRPLPVPLLLLLLPSLTTALSAAAQDNIQSALTKNTQPRDAKTDPIPSPVIDLSKAKYDVGTKDAPVDGKDGKPHAGPFVGSEKDTKTPKSGPEEVEVLEGVGKETLSELNNADGKIPLANDGVMDDPHRLPPKQGTTGTEGGVSEKDKARKAKEGQTGEKSENKPDSPKEAPPLPESEQAMLKGEKSKPKEPEKEDDNSAEGLAGLEV